MQFSVLFSFGMAYCGGELKLFGSYFDQLKDERHSSERRSVRLCS
jgi:hypothetical protein